MSSSLNVQLTDALRKYVDERASDKDVYATPSEYIRDLIRQDMQDRAIALNVLEGLDDLHAGAQFIAENHSALRRRQELSGGTRLLVYPVRELYIVYEPLAERFIAVVAVIRQGRDIPAILQKWSVPIRRELIEIRARVARGEITWPTRSAASARRKK